jgi:hypothetical protein
MVALRKEKSKGARAVHSRSQPVYVCSCCSCLPLLLLHHLLRYGKCERGGGGGGDEEGTYKPPSVVYVAASLLTQRMYSTGTVLLPSVVTANNPCCQSLLSLRSHLPPVNECCQELVTAHLIIMVHVHLLHQLAHLQAAQHSTAWHGMV